MSSSTAGAFPIVTRQVASDIAGFPTEILLQVFDDRTLVIVSQGRVGRMIQVTPPTSSRQRRRAAAYEDDFDEATVKNDDDAVHLLLSSLHLPSPDPSCEIITLFGTPRTEEIGQLEQVWAHQIATIILTSSSSEELANKPVIVGLGMKAAFLDVQDLEVTRNKYAQLMKLVQSVLAA